MRWPLAIGGVAALAVVAVALTVLLALRAPAPAADTPLHATPPHAPPPAIATGRFQLGINEAVAVPARIREGLGAGELDTRLQEDATRAREVGAVTVRGHTGNLPRISHSAWKRSPTAWEEGDAWVRAVQGAALEPLAMISPWPGNQTFNHTDTYVPTDMAGYQTYVSTVVERYDGDGVEDMPGLVGAVRYWEVDNEPDLKWSTAPKGGEKPFTPETFCTPEEYAQVLVATSAAIKSAFPGATVLNGGFFRPHTDNGLAYMTAVFSSEAARAATDILSVHTYKDGDGGDALGTAIRNIRSLAPGKPVWVTETSVGVGKDADPAEQGRMVAALAGIAAVAGAERLYWHTLADPPPSNKPREGPGGFRTNSLFATNPEGGLTWKPAATVYRNLAAQLAKHDLAGATALGDGSARLGDGSVLLWSGEVRAGTGGMDLATGLALAPGSVARAPAFLEPPLTPP